MKTSLLSFNIKSEHLPTITQDSFFAISLISFASFTNNSSELPQTGIEDYNIGILLIICTISAIYAYNKVKQYKNI